MEIGPNLERYREEGKGDNGLQIPGKVPQCSQLPSSRALMTPSKSWAKVRAQLTHILRSKPGAKGRPSLKRMGSAFWVLTHPSKEKTAPHSRHDVLLHHDPTALPALAPCRVIGWTLPHRALTAWPSCHHSIPHPVPRPEPATRRAYAAFPSLAHP